jgi:polar amino acid transport system substrate-binding protein
MLARLFLALAILAFAAPAQAEKIRLATEGAYPPFNYVGDDGKVGGFDVDLGNELCKRAALDCEWVVNDWDSLITNLVAGNYRAIIADMFITEERQKTIDFTEPYFPPDPSIWMARAGAGYDYANLKGLKIGTQTGTVQAEWLDKHLKDTNTIVRFDNDDQIVADLRAGNIDVMLAESSYVRGQVSGSAGEFEIGGPAILIGGSAAIGIQKSDFELKTKFNTALAAMKADGSLDALIFKYFPDLGPGPFFLN